MYLAISNTTIISFFTLKLRSYKYERFHDISKYCIYIRYYVNDIEHIYYVNIWHRIEMTFVLSLYYKVLHTLHPQHNLCLNKYFSERVSCQFSCLLVRQLWGKKCKSQLMLKQFGLKICVFSLCKIIDSERSVWNTCSFLLLIF